MVSCVACVLGAVVLRVDEKCALIGSVAGFSLVWWVGTMSWRWRVRAEE